MPISSLQLAFCVCVAGKSASLLMSMYRLINHQLEMDTFFRFFDRTCCIPFEVCLRRGLQVCPRIFGGTLLQISTNSKSWGCLNIGQGTGTPKLWPFNFGKERMKKLWQNDDGHGYWMVHHFQTHHFFNSENSNQHGYEGLSLAVSRGVYPKFDPKMGVCFHGFQQGA